MAVMKKTIGLSAYTHRVSNHDFLEGKTIDQINTEYALDNYVYQNIYTITANVVNINVNELVLNVRIKEYSEVWKTGIRNIEGLTSVYNQKVELKRGSGVVTIYSGNHEVRDVIKSLLETRFHWPLQPYAIKEITAQKNQIGSVSFKTAVILDFILNRLKEQHSISSGFKEIKFSLGTGSDGIKNVTINGRDILTTPLACEYISLGHDIESFKVSMALNGVDFQGIFYLKGVNKDKLKIVIVDVDDETFKANVMSIIQNEYICLCNVGIFNLVATIQLLESIKIKFVHKDTLVKDAIESNTLNLLEIFIGLMNEKLDTEDAEVIRTANDFIQAAKIISQSIGSDKIETYLHDMEDAQSEEE